MKEYGALALNTALCVLVPLLLMVLTSVLGPKRFSKPKAQPFETGFVLPYPKRSPYRPAFLLYGVLFVVFDMEIAFLYPWAVSFRFIGASGLFVLFFFLAILGFGLAYAWRKGALEWK
ncbi:NADH-quinone oxidoreductase subunit A [Candidatus Eisenbacteria bacterium]|uniref:NADH-quinone oxidoreductase subunit n=1 Tax=Eiseniibacteriota bacterium TaxID=2212470 RepID=A0ABV6YIV1_UNCEI